jgi:tRNA U55 pseudouridine synthase TruB
MQIIYKEIGKTPKQALDEFRNKNPGLKDEILSYMGRLDPMATGQMIILIGKQENQDRNNFMNLDKEYLAQFLIGAETDSGDILGLMTDFIKEDFNFDNSDFLKSFQDEITDSLLEIKKINRQKFPWFSSKTVSGKALFTWFKENKQNEIERPDKKIEIKKIDNLKFKIIKLDDIQREIIRKINLVQGDFRQKETIEKWENFFQKQKELANENFMIFEIKLIVSSGTYIRGLCEEFKKQIKKPVLLYALERTDIFLGK